MSLGQVHLEKAMARNSLILMNIFDKQCGQMSNLFDYAIARKCLILMNGKNLSKE
jgi:hypothetical protein